MARTPQDHRPGSTSSLLVAAGWSWACACVLALATPVRAQVAGVEGFRLDTFLAAPTPEDGLVVQTPSTLGHLRWSAQLLLDYARDPLVSDGFGAADPSEVKIVEDRLSAQALVALGLGERGEIFVRIPATLYQGGDEPNPGGLRYPVPAVGGFGDISLGGSVRLFGDDEGFSSGFHGGLWLPTGSRDALSGDGNVGVRGGFSLQYKARATALAFESGANYRPKNDYGFTVSGTQWYYRAGLHVWLKPDWRLLIELDGAMRVTDGQAFETDQNSVEGLVAARYGEGGGLYATVGVGLGLISMAGTPLVRGVFGLGWASEPRPETRQPVAKSAEPAPPPPPPANPDRDRDGLLDEDDQCPSDPEDLDGFEDEDGCPDEDDDRDGVRDAMDQCPDEQEDFDGDRDEDGCPDLDEPEPTPETQASPAPAPEPEPEVEASAAPVAAATVATTAPRSERPPNVRFGQNTMKFDRETRRDLWAVLSWFAEYPGDYDVRLVGHASQEGEEWRNDALSRGRALVVANWLDGMASWLTQHGVSLRITTEGRGSSEPLSADNAVEARARSRRVEVYVERP